MQTLTEVEVNTVTIIHFLSMYRTFEKQPLLEGYKLIKILFRNDSRIASHLCDHWHSKKRDFGTFYLNLDNPAQYKFLEYWGIAIDGWADYMVRREKDEFAVFFEKPPRLFQVLHNIILFFNNHGIYKNPIPDLNLTMIPRSDKRCFGNAANWANYILTLFHAEQSRVLKSIANQYEIAA